MWLACGKLETRSSYPVGKCLNGDLVGASPGMAQILLLRRSGASPEMDATSLLVIEKIDCKPHVNGTAVMC